MKIVFQTNIDAYNGQHDFPQNLTFVPRQGELVQVIKEAKEKFRYKKLPIQLEVVGVTYTETCIICELHYNNTDFKIATLAGGKPYG